MINITNGCNKTIRKRFKRNLSRLWLISLIFIGQVLVFGGCGKQDELVFQSDTEQTQSATDSLALEELEQVEQQAEISSEQTQQADADMDMSITQEKTLIYVDICGAVEKPGVYQVDSNSRLFEVIELAGGLKEDAATRFVNQARTLVDGEQIVILTKDEAEEALASGELIQTNTAIQGSEAGKSSETGSSANTQISTKVNINTASAQELTTLTGVGESKANLIIQYRENNGGFSSTEEIMNIEGIGEKTYAKFAENITVQ